MEFDNLEELKNVFISGGGFQFLPEFLVAGVKFTNRSAQTTSMKEIIEKNIKPMWIYIAMAEERAKANEAGLKQVIIFRWRSTSNNTVVPYDVRTTTMARIIGAESNMTEAETDKITIHKGQLIGNEVEVNVVNMSNSPSIKAKVDTGADISSLHAENWKIDNGQVTFESKELSSNMITLPVIEKQLIKTSNGDMEYRPVIKLSIKINGILINDVLFNLNDRGTMNFAMLIGRNALEQGKFMIDPSISEDFEIDWNGLQEYFKNDDVILDDVQQDDMTTDYIKSEEIIEFIKSKIKQ